MKLKAILLGSILVVALFCISNQSQANLGPPYGGPISYPSEHPWQHDNSLESEDSLNCSTPHIVILPIGFHIKVIRFFQGFNSTKGLIDRPGRIKNDQNPGLYSGDKR